MLKTFRGGVHPNDMKAPTESKKIVELDPSQEMVYPMTQHIGAPAKPIVKPGDFVYAGQKIAEAGGFVSACIHSTVSGTVKAVEKRMHPNGLFVESVVIEDDGQDTMYPDFKGCDDYTKLTKAELIEIIKEAGVVGLGGATFPTHVKLSPPPEANIDYVIVNAAECEPYLTSDYRAMLETPEQVIGGLKILMHMFDLKDGYVGIENNKEVAIETMSAIAAKNKDVNIHIETLKTKYPQGGEKQLINAITGRKVGPGQLPWQVGAIVCNVDTCRAIYQAVRRGLPVMTRIVTTGGDCVKNPGNYKIRIGMKLSDIIEQTGGFIKEPKKVVMGGPMMGLALPNIDVPAIKGTSGFLAFGEEYAYGLEESACLRCGKCVYVCPMKLLPNRLDEAARADNYEALEKLNINDCIECGSCAYSCPSKRRQVQQIKVAKVKLREAQQRK
ncbi:MAG: electron transport complex subunit RsxC [Clostridiales bacterium]|nr:electron transport complex subunit RsxC [Clostridiales bacterium]